MRIFLTGATGYIGAAVLDALVRAGHDVTALVRDNQKAARVKARGGHPVIGNLAEPESFRTAADAQDGYIHTAFDTTGGGPAIDKAALETIVRAATRPRTAASNGPKKRFIIYTSGVWVLGSRAGAGHRGLADQAGPAGGVAARSRAVRARTRPDPGFATIVVRPGIVYGGGHGIVGDLLKSASNGLVRVIGDGNNHWPLIYDRDLADLYARLAADENAAGVYHANDEGDERVNDIVSAIAPYLPVRPDVGTCRSKRRARRWARMRMRSRSIRWSAARAHVRSGGRRRCGLSSGNAARLLEEWRASRTSRAGRKAGALTNSPSLPAATRFNPAGCGDVACASALSTAIGVGAGSCPATIPSTSPYSSALSRVEIEVGSLGVPDDLAERLAGSRRQNLVNLILHLLQPLEMLRRRGR